MYSLEDFFDMNNESLRKDIFVLDFATNNSAKDHAEPGNKSQTFVQIKRQKFKSESKAYNMLKIIDVSMDLLYERTCVEKKLHTVINATVSHEMRNPINAM